LAVVGLFWLFQGSIVAPPEEATTTGQPASWSSSDSPARIDKSASAEEKQSTALQSAFMGLFWQFQGSFVAPPRRIQSWRRWASVCEEFCTIRQEYSTSCMATARSLACPEYLAHILACLEYLAHILVPGSLNNLRPNRTCCALALTHTSVVHELI
jgi:hypothetical protein